MREQIARLLCGLSLAVVIALACVFAVRHNPPRPSLGSPPSTQPVPSSAAQASEAQIARGLVLFAELECSTCHSFRGQGNPRRPLDDSSARRGAAELASWITGTGPAATALSPAVLKRKQPYQSLSPADLAALVALLSSHPATDSAAQP